LRRPARYHNEQMSDTQLLTIVLASAAPTMLTVLVGILINNARLTDLRTHLDVRFANIDQRFNDLDRRFDEMRDLSPLEPPSTRD